MIFNTDFRDVATAGTIKSSDITLSANAKAFKIIFNQIYPDIIKAIVRELFANAWDSQKAAGTLNKKPIEIILPTLANPIFSIRDYGTGMTPEVIDTVYSAVYESTKDKDNESAGMFGMGSKTPLGYTDSFTLVSYVDGMFYAYSIYINSNGTPKIDLVATGETDEENGVLVQLAVKPEDFKSFQQHAELFALNSGVAVDINKERVLNTSTPILSVADGHMYGANSGVSGFFIRMGCILYKINVSHIYSYFYTEVKDSPRAADILRFNMIVDFNIGDFDVTGSREDIIYTKESVNRILAKLDKWIDAVHAHINEQIATSKTIVEALSYLSVITESKIYFNLSELKWRGISLSKVCTLSNYLRTPAAVNPFHRGYTYLTFPDSIKFVRDIDCLINSSSMKREKVYDKIVSHHNFKNVVVVFDKDDRYIRAKLKLLIVKIYAEQKLKPIDYTTYEDYRADTHYNLIIAYRPTSKLAMTRLKHLIPNQEFYDAAELPAREAVGVSDKQRLTYSVEKRKAPTLYIDDHDKKVGLSSVLKEVKDGSYYVEVDGRTLQQGYSDLNKYCKLLNVSGEDVYAISKMRRHLIQEKNLVSLIEAVKEFEYSRSTIIYNLLRRDTPNLISGRFKFGAYNREILSRKYLPMLMEWIGVEGYDANDLKNVDLYTPNISKAAKEQHNAVQKEIIEGLNKLLELNPLLAYIDNATLLSSCMNIFEKLQKVK